MKTGFAGKITRIAGALAVVGAIAGGIVAGIGSSQDADAALKWREEAVKWTAKAQKCKDKDLTCTTTTDTTTAP